MNSNNYAKSTMFITKNWVLLQMHVFKRSRCTKDSGKGFAGMDGGHRLVTLERSEVNWLCRSNSVVLSQQFDKEVCIILTMGLFCVLQMLVHIHIKYT